MWLDYRQLVDIANKYWNRPMRFPGGFVICKFVYYKFYSYKLYDWLYEVQETIVTRKDQVLWEIRSQSGESHSMIT